MTLLSRLFYRRPPDGLLELVDRIYVFDSCFLSKVLAQGLYQFYLHKIINDLHEEFPESSFLAFNVQKEEKRSQFSEILGNYGVTVIDYPIQYNGSPLLPLSIVHHIFDLFESWISLGNHKHIILIHCEKGVWLPLAFLLASIMIFKKIDNGEHKILEAVYQGAPKGFSQMLSPSRPYPAQLCYLKYISKSYLSPAWPPLERVLSLDCLILCAILKFDNRNGCRPIIWVYRRDLFSKDGLRHYYQDSDLKIDIQCLVQGDVLMLSRENLDTLWDSKAQFPNGFRAEILEDSLLQKISETVNSVVSTSGSGDSCNGEDPSALPNPNPASVEIYKKSIDQNESVSASLRPLPLPPIAVSCINASQPPAPPPRPPPPQPPFISFSVGKRRGPPPPPRSPPLEQPLLTLPSKGPPPPPPLPQPVSSKCPPTPPPAPPPPPLGHNGAHIPPAPKPLGHNAAGTPPSPPPPPRAPNLSPPPPPKTKSSNVLPPPPPYSGRNRPPGGSLNSGIGRVSAGSLIPSKRTCLKPLHWVKVTRVMQGSLWADTQKHENQSRAPEIDISELESLFSAAFFSDNTGKNGARRGSKINKPQKVQLVELRRAYNCEIMLTKIKIPLPDMIDAILALDSSSLDIDQIDNLIKFCPTKEEMETLKNYTGDKELLGKCEQVNDLGKNLTTINNATREVKQSAKLRQIMLTILMLGNALNQGTARGSAIGFKLESLLKLSDTRAKNNKMTLMHYLCKLLAEKKPELLDFEKDVVHLEAASKIQLKNLAEEMQAVSKGLEKVDQELAASDQDGVVSAGFQKALKLFLDTAEAEVRALMSLYTEVGRNADSLSRYFGEDPSGCPFEHATQILVLFSKMFKKARYENEHESNAEKRKLEKEVLKDMAHNTSIFIKQ